MLFGCSYERSRHIRVVASIRLDRWPQPFGTRTFRHIGWVRHLLIRWAQVLERAQIQILSHLRCIGLGQFLEPSCPRSCTNMYFDTISKRSAQIPSQTRSKWKKSKPCAASIFWSTHHDYDKIKYLWKNVIRSLNRSERHNVYARYKKENCGTVAYPYLLIVERTIINTCNVNELERHLPESARMPRKKSILQAIAEKIMYGNGTMSVIIKMYEPIAIAE